MPMPKLSIIPPIDIDDYESRTDTESLSNTPINIPDHLNKLYSSMNNYYKLTDGKFGNKFMDDKTKRQFTHKVERSSTLGVRLMYFKNSIENTFTKIFIYSKDEYLEPTSVLIKILSEVFYHTEFSKLQQTCRFRTPTLLEYGFIEDNNDENININSNEYVFYIKMEDISAVPVTKLNELVGNNKALDTCMTIEKEVDRIDTCLQKYNLHHNDLHTDNVMIDKNGEIVIIDFGESSNLLQKPFYTVDFCGKIKRGGMAKYRKQPRRTRHKKGIQTKKRTNRNRKRTTRNRKRTTRNRK